MTTTAEVDHAPVSGHVRCVSPSCAAQAVVVAVSAEVVVRAIHRVGWRLVDDAGATGWMCPRCVHER